MIAVTRVSANGLEMTQKQLQQKLTNPRLTPVERELLLQQLHHLAQVAKNKPLALETTNAKQFIRNQHLLAHCNQV